jgi:hypothetical protein
LSLLICFNFQIRILSKNSYWTRLKEIILTNEWSQSDVPAMPNVEMVKWNLRNYECRRNKLSMTRTSN